MTEATKLVTRIVTGPKPIHAFDDEGNRKIFEVGEEVKLTPNAAKRFARYLAAPEVAAAQAKVAEAEAEASVEATKPEPKPKPAYQGASRQSQGGGS